MMNPASNENMKRNESGVSDMITNLPDTVLESILIKLPQSDAVRTSIFSKKWRYKWTEIPQFIFDDTLLVAGEDSVRTFTKVMYHFMSLHKGPVLKFTLSVYPLESCPEIDNLIVFLSRNGIVDLTIEMWREIYSLPSAFFTCQHLKHLNLRGCQNMSPPAFQGFSKLTSLKLDYCIITTEALEILIAKAPLLEQLELIFGYCIDLYIDAPNLRVFSFDGDTKSIRFKYEPLLTSVSICLPTPPTKAFECSLNNYFQGVPALETLCLNYHMVQSFAVPQDPTIFAHLKHLNLAQMSFNKVVALQLTLILMKSSPNLRCFEIQFDNGSVTRETTLNMKGEDFSNIWLSKLKEVTLDWVTGTKLELVFIKFLLLKSPTLKRLRIKPSYMVMDSGRKILTEVIKFQRVSSEAQVIYG